MCVYFFVVLLFLFCLRGMRSPQDATTSSSTELPEDEIKHFDEKEFDTCDEGIICKPPFPNISEFEKKASPVRMMNFALEFL